MGNNSDGLEPDVRYAELTSASSVYDFLKAAASADDTVVMWFVLGIITTALTLWVAPVLIALISDRGIRKSPFNLYIIFLMIPDFVFTLFCAITCWRNYAAKQYVSEMECNWQTWYAVFAITCNSWISAWIAREMYTLLSCSEHRKRYNPPSTRTVCLQSLGTYSFAGVVAALPLFGIPWLPFENQMAAGFFCMPLEYSTASTLFYFLVFLPLSCWIPMMYVNYVICEVYRRDLLPPNGRRRDLSLLFARLVLVFFLLWTPNMICVFYLRRLSHPWASWASSVWAHLYMGVSTAYILTKPDVRQSVLKFLTCRRRSTGSTSFGNDDGHAPCPSAAGSYLVAQRRSGMYMSANRRLSFIQTIDQVKYPARDDGLPHQSEDGFDFVDEIIEEDEGSTEHDPAEESGSSQYNGLRCISCSPVEEPIHEDHSENGPSLDTGSTERSVLDVENGDV